MWNRKVLEVFGECEASVLWFVSSWAQMLFVVNKGLGLKMNPVCQNSTPMSSRVPGDAEQKSSGYCNKISLHSACCQMSPQRWGQCDAKPGIPISGWGSAGDVTRHGSVWEGAGSELSAALEWREEATRIPKAPSHTSLTQGCRDALPELASGTGSPAPGGLCWCLREWTEPQLCSLQAVLMRQKSGKAGASFFTLPNNQLIPILHFEYSLFYWALYLVWGLISFLLLSEELWGQRVHPGPVILVFFRDPSKSFHSSLKGSSGYSLSVFLI